MAKINVYLPEELSTVLHRHDINVSRVCQAALREELDNAGVLEYTEEDVVVCSNCKFYSLVMPDRGECRRNAPQHSVGGAIMVDGDYWCGEFKYK